MSLRTKIILSLTAVVTLWAMADHFLLSRMVTGQFRALGEEEAERGMQLVESSIQSHAQQLTDKASLFASMPEMQRAVAAGDRDYLSAQLGSSALAAANLDLLFVCAPDGTVLWNRIEAPSSDEEIHLRDFPTEQLAPTHPLLKRKPEEWPSSFFLTGQWVLLASSLPVGETGGKVLVGRFLDEGFVAEIEAHSSIPFRIRDLREAVLDDWETQPASEAKLDPGQLAIHTDAEGNMYAFKALADIWGHSNVLLRSDIEHGILARGKKATDYLALSTLGTSILIFLVLLRVLQKTIILPLSHLTKFAVRVAETDDTSARVKMTRGDEVGILAKEFDRMLEEIESSRNMLVKTARLAGMSEIATGVLHNVGNILNSVNVSANLVHQKTEQLSVADLQRMVDVLTEREEDLAHFVSEDPRGKHTLPFLRELSKSLDQQRDGIRKEIGGLREGIDHIAELVRAQQSYAGTKGVFERASLAAQVEAAVKISRQAYGGVDGIDFISEFEEDLPSVSIDKHKLMEILVNLIQNAKQALDESDQPRKRITLRVLRVDGHTARIEVEDNGMGIAPMNLENIFHHGFTTKRDGHGFGLHVSSNAAKEMSSKLHVRSDGPGRGAVFMLDIPIHEDSSLQAA